MNHTPFLFKHRLVQPAFLAGIAIITVLISAYAHIQAGFTLPTPWNDEPWFLWSSISFMESNTLFSESLNPERLVLMSPIYQVSMALLFKLTGFSFSLARWVSWGYLTLAYGGILVLIRSRPFPVLSALTASLYFLGATAVVAGNIVRPETMVLAIAVWSFVLLEYDQGWKALSLAGIGVLVHQIGFLFFAGVSFIFCLNAIRKKGRISPAAWDWVIMGFGLLLLAGQMALIWVNWTAYWADSMAAASEAHQQGLLSRLFVSNKTPWVLVYGGLLGLSLWRFRTLLIPVVLGGCAFSAMLMRPQMWYEIYNQMAFLWLALLIPWVLVLGVESRISRSKKTIADWLKTGLLLGMFGMGCLPMLRMAYGHAFITGPNHYPGKLEWGWGMQVDPSPYISDRDIRAVIDEIEKHVVDGRPYRIFFMPEADALFFYGRLPTNVVPYQGVHASILGDLAVFRFSRHPPAWWTEQHVLPCLRLYGGEGITPFYERDGTEQWILVPAGAD